MELRRAALAVLAITDPGEKIAAVASLAVAAATIDPSAQIPEPAGLPGRPARPLLVPASRVPARSTATAVGRAALLHSIAHIEYNAINLALDAIWRFPGLPDGYYRDWLQVAREEARHHELLAKHLATLGVAYGDFDAHNGLWEMAERTRGDVLARMALVPRTLEARGLDATPGIRARFVASGDTAAGDILDIILRDEIGHVAIGNRWYRHLCGVRGCDPHLTYEELASRLHAPRLRGPFNVEARRRAGFDEAEIDSLQNLIPRQREPGKGLAGARDRSDVGSNPAARPDRLRPHPGGCMNWATLLTTPVGELLWKKKQDLRRRETNKPPIGATICCAGLRMTVQAGLSDELWRWLVSLGWRELNPGESRLKLKPLPTGLVTRMFDSEPADRERVLLGAIRQVTRRPVMRPAERVPVP